MPLRIEFAFLLIDLSLLFVVGCNRIISYILKGKVRKSLVDLIDIISILPIIPIYWASRQQIESSSSRDITFYVALIGSIALLIMLILKTYLYNKEQNEIEDGKI